MHYYYQIRTFTSGELQNECGVSTFTVRGVFIGVNGNPTDLERSVWHQVEAKLPSHVAGQLGGAASIDFLHRLGLLLLM
jgi:hypothetical protein